MSLDNLTPAEFAKWFQLGQSVRRMMGKGDATMYSYNGVVLPKLPTVAGYTNIYICKNVAAFRYLLLLCPSEMVATGNGGITSKNGEDMTILTYYRSYYASDDVGWGEADKRTYEFSTGYSLVEPFWCNATLYDKNGAVHLESTTPVPVFE